MHQREEDIFAYLLMAKGITHYEIVDYIPEGHELPGCIYPDEIISYSGLIVTMENIYRYWLAWEGEKEGHYTLGDEREFWQEVSLAALDDLDTSLVLDARKRLYEHTAAPALPADRQPGALTPREADIVRILLRRHEIEQYTLVTSQHGDRDLIGCLYLGEIQNTRGIIATADGGYRFQLNYQWGDYYIFSTWKRITAQECTQPQWQAIERAQQHFLAIRQQEHIPAQEEKRDKEQRVIQEQLEQWNREAEEADAQAWALRQNADATYDLSQDNEAGEERIRRLRYPGGDAEKRKM